MHIENGELILKEELLSVKPTKLSKNKKIKREKFAFKLFERPDGLLQTHDGKAVYAQQNVGGTLKRLTPKPIPKKLRRKSV